MSILESEEKILLTRRKRDAEDPSGTLRVSCKANHFDYYQYYPKGTPDRKKSGNYIKKENIQLARQLAQKEYDKKALAVISTQRKLLEKMLSNHSDTAVRDVFSNMPLGKQVLVNPVELPDDEFIQQWEGVEYVRKPVNMYEEFYTEKGERVRSKSEILIANKLYKEGIPYRYEQPIEMKNHDTFHPDFRVLNVRTRKEILWEHCGMMDSERYYNDFVERVNVYQQNGFFVGENLILTFETKKHPLNKKQIEAIIERYLV